MTLVRPGEPASVRDVGGKGRSLLDLHARGLPVPDFFVVTTEVHRRADRDHLASADRERVVAAWHDLGGPSIRVAVRSSGVDEDSVDDSYAGVFDTVLDVGTADQVVEAVERCWASARSATADAYRRDRRSAGAPAMAVVVQHMVPAEWAGVTFTADPIRQALSAICVNAVPGGGESLVSGTADPEEITVDARSRCVTARRRPAGRLPLPNPVLAKVIELSMQTVDGLPQDVEWAAVGSDVWLLQSRPITTVAEVAHARSLEPWCNDPKADPDAPARTWTRAYADEMWTPPVSPLFYDLQNLSPMVTTYLRRHGDRNELPPDVFKYHGAAAYLDVALLERLLELQPRSLRTEGALSQLPMEQRERVRDAPWNWRGVVRRLAQFEIRHRKKWAVAHTWQHLDRAWAGFLARAHSWGTTELQSLGDAELDAFEEEVRAHASTIGPECSIAVTYHAADLRLVLTGLLDRWVAAPDAPTYADVSSGLEDSFTVSEAQEIWNIASMLRQSNGADRIFRGGIDLTHAREHAESLGLRRVLDAFDRFLADHGHRGANYKDVVHPRWGDQPDALWSLVISEARIGGEPPVRRHEAAASRRRTAQAEVLEMIKGPMRPLKRVLVGRLFPLNERYAALRDNHRYYYDHVWWAYRRVYLERGRRLVERGHLARADDVMFLCREEIETLGTHGIVPGDFAERIRIRRRSWERARHVAPPKFITAGYLPLADTVAELADEDGSETVVGIAASPGEVIGTVRVAHDVTELYDVQEGDILVARQTDPSWSPLFPRLGGLILETGGVLAHGASLCREYGLPCVTVVERATSLFTTGDVVGLSGSTGRISVLARVRAEERR